MLIPATHFTAAKVAKDITVLKLRQEFKSLKVCFFIYLFVFILSPGTMHAYEMSIFFQINKFHLLNWSSWKAEITRFLLLHLGL